MILKRFIARKIDEITEEAIGVSTSQLKTMMKEIEETPAPKSVSGATRIYLNQIERDFPEFSESEAEREIILNTLIVYTVFQQFNIINL